jgi:hypothetical protein
MAWNYKLSFQPGGKVAEVLTPTGYFYVLPDGRRVRMSHRYVWCFKCNGFSWAEELPSLETVNQSIKTWQDPNSEERVIELKEYRFLDQQQCVVERQLRRLYDYRDLLQARTEPCHCTQCGSTEFVEVPDGAEFTLPNGSGTVMMRCTGHATVFASESCYTPNGHPILTKDVPSAPSEPKYPMHYDWKERLFGFGLLVTIPIWGPIALLILAAITIRRAWANLGRQWITKATPR